MFEHGPTWKEVQAKAKAENKYIFMDAFATWCGPCKYMAKNIFPQEAVGEFFNSKYINVKVQLDTTDSDNEEVKKWYADAHAIMQDHKVEAFPTYLFFSPEGKLVHRSVGASEAPAFVAKGKDALDPGKQFYTLYEQFKAGKNDPDFLKKMSLAAMEAYDMEVLKQASGAFINSSQNLLTKENIDFIARATTGINDPGFKLMLNNQAKFDELAGKGFTNQRLVSLISEDEVYPIVWGKKFDKNWDELAKTLTAKYPAQAEEVILTSKISYYQSTKDWNNFQANIVNFMDKYGANLDNNRLNEFAWTVFENCADIRCVKEALAWSKRSIAKVDQPEYIDTYANLLYKLGKKTEAINWEKKALALAQDDNKTPYQETLDKMLKGEKTWKD